MTEVTVAVTENVVEVVSPTAANVNVTSSVDTVLIDRPNWAYMQAYDVGDQTAANTTSTFQVRHNTLDGHYLISNSNGLFTFSQAGTYSMTFSVQLQNSDSAEHDVNVFLKKNQQLFVDSNSRVTVPARHGQIPGSVIVTVNFLIQFVPGDTCALWWQTSNTACAIKSFAATTGPDIPQTPGVITTFVQVS